MTDGQPTKAAGALLRTYYHNNSYPTAGEESRVFNDVFYEYFYLYGIVIFLTALKYETGK